MPITERLTEGVRTALANAGLPEPETCVWEVPRQAEHGDYATNVAMTLARAARRPPRQVAELIVKHFPSLREVERLDVAGPGFLNVFLSPAWCTGALGEILEAGDAYGRGEGERGRRVRLEFVSANPTGPLVIVSARAAAVGDSLARLLRAQGRRSPPSTTSTTRAPSSRRSRARSRRASRRSSASPPRSPRTAIRAST